MNERLTSLTLVEGLLNHQDGYWRRLDVLYGPIIEFWISKTGLSSEVAADLHQEILLAVVQNISTYHHAEASGSLRRWIWGIARNKIADQLRLEYRHASAKGGTEALIKINEIPERPFEETEQDNGQNIRRELVDRALGILETDFEPTTWRAFWMTVVEERSPDDVSQELGMRKQAIRQARYRVLKRLREELGDE